MTSMFSLFMSYKVSSEKDKIRVADNSYLSIASYGDIPATTSLLLSFVFHVPNFTLNLLSISQLTKSLNCSATFFPSYCLFQDLETKKTISMGYKKDDLYILDLDPQSSFATSTVERDISPTTTDELF